LLIDFKSTSTTRTCSKTDVWQVCGYALADTNDQYKIRSVGLSLLRWRTQASWALDELLPMLAGEPTSLAELRGEFAALLPRVRKATTNDEISDVEGRRPDWGPGMGQDGRMVWRCASCGELGTAREGEPVTLPTGASMVRILLPPNWRQHRGRPICSACRKHPDRGPWLAPAWIAGRLCSPELPQGRMDSSVSAKLSSVMSPMRSRGRTAFSEQSSRALREPVRLTDH
jgi:hypothetical protein